MVNSPGRWLGPVLVEEPLESGFGEAWIEWLLEAPWVMNQAGVGF